MPATSARLLDLLGLLQARRVWSGPELAERLSVTERTVRNDIARLRELGYPIEAERGSAGGYRFGHGGSRLPPLILGEDEAVAVAVALRSTMAIEGLADGATSAAAKLERTMPDRLQRRIRALIDSTEVGPTNTATNVPDPVIDAGLLAGLASAIAGHEGIRIWYGRDRRGLSVDPYRLVSWQGRWYLVGRDRRDGEWRSYRCDLIELRTPGESRFVPRPLADGEYSELVLRTVAEGDWTVRVSIAVDAPAEVVRARINPAVGVVEAVDDQHSVLLTGADSLQMIAVYIGMLGLDFHIAEPPELVEHLRVLGQRYQRALPT